MPQTQPAARSHSLASIVEAPARSSGYANIKKNVPVLPHHVTSKRLTPIAPSHNAAIATSTSRVSVNAANHIGTEPSIHVDATAVTSMILSAAGSSTLPNSLT